MAQRWHTIRQRVKELFSPFLLLLAVLVFRFISSFTSWIKAILLTWGVMDGVMSNYLYKHERLHPHQLLRYARIVANFSGIANPLIPVVWNIGDGIYSMYLYRQDSAVLEQIPRYGRVLNGSLLAILA